MRRAARMPSSVWVGGIRMSVSTASGRASATARSALLTGGPARASVLWSLAWIAGILVVFAPLAVARHRRLA
jgi:hypothetical protein